MDLSRLEPQIYPLPELTANALHAKCRKVRAGSGKKCQHLPEFAKNWKNSGLVCAIAPSDWVASLLSFPDYKLYFKVKSISLTDFLRPPNMDLAWCKGHFLFPSYAKVIGFLNIAIKRCTCIDLKFLGWRERVYLVLQSQIHKLDLCF